MENLENLTNVKTSVGDVAVSGLFNGLLAGAAICLSGIGRSPTIG